MSEEKAPDPWAKIWLLKEDTSDSQEEPILIEKPKFIIGRAQNCDFCVTNKRVSGHHCYLEREETGDVFLCDTSSNGTLLNKTKIVKHEEKVYLKSGDEFYLTYVKSDENANIGFKIELLKDEENEPNSQSTLPCSFADETEEYDVTNEQDENDVVKTGEKSEKDIETDDKNEPKEVESINPIPDKKPKVMDESTDEIEDTLLCCICQELLHNCISLQPCMHCYCASCYSDWMEQSNDCPQCRSKVDRLSWNYLVNNLVEAYLKKFPEKRRSDEEIKALDARNKITPDMLAMPSKKRKHSSYSSTGSSSSSSSDSPSRDFSIVTIGNILSWNAINHLTCKQCPGSSSAPGNSSSNEAATSFTCGPNQVHMLCACCLKKMPDRKMQRLQDPSIPSQTCSMCYRIFCSMYWTCDRVGGCRGCLNHFKDIVLGDDCMNQLINNNTHESEILKDYLLSKNLTWKELFDICIEKLRTGIYQCNDAVTPDTPVCQNCALKYFKQLAYQYRKNIDNKDLPGPVTSRLDCYWGRNCRTQIKPHHARNFNHICEQTRF